MLNEVPWGHMLDDTLILMQLVWCTRGFDHGVHFQFKASKVKRHHNDHQPGRVTVENHSWSPLVIASGCWNVLRLRSPPLGQVAKVAPWRWECFALVLWGFHVETEQITKQSIFGIPMAHIYTYICTYIYIYIYISRKVASATWVLRASAQA